MAEDDSWAFVPIGHPFPEDPVRVRGEMNQYVALWYKHGKAVCGRAWNNGGVVECSFPFNGKELTGAKDLGGEIQILTNPMAPDPISSYKARAFWYEWIPYRRRLEPHLAMVRCGNTAPILMKGPGGKSFVGSLDLTTDIAAFSEGGKATTKEGGLLDYHVICRNHDKPPGYDAVGKKKVQLMEGMEDDWVDRRVNDPYPDHAIKTLDRPLKLDNAQSCVFAVALWYKHGEPVMGRCFEDRAGKVQAAFGWGGHGFTSDAGSIQVLRYDVNEYDYEYEYKWMPYGDAVKKTGGYRPVHVGDAAPCIIKTPDGFERLGQVLLSKEVASAAYGDKEESFSGPVVQTFLVLCRKP